ncbi:Purine nucleoside phosphorylase DeoD-type [Paraconexibacter sp. AEG42_29]|uniref:Uridine phosphorylase n=1 Tax=Paraconexibacter sp. AEG42_29 TaxID=2997339 RepID=A0AAU7ASS9_9ACTN
MPAQVNVLRPTNALAERALLCGDPARCLGLATALLDRPLMFNHARGLWGYTGTAADGAPLTIQATGLGAASAAIVTDELFRLGLRTAIRVGTARALPVGGDDALTAGDALVVTGALAGDGPSRALGAGDVVRPDPRLAAALAADAPTAGLVATSDLLQAPATTSAADGSLALAADLQTATVLQVAALHGLPAAAILVVTGAVAGGDGGLDDDALLAAVRRAAAVAALAFGIPARTAPPLPPPREDERPADSGARVTA